MKKVFIEGAGLAGLTCAARLQKFKYQTFLVGEPFRNTIIDGFEFDTAPLFTLPAVYRDFFQKTGKHFGQVLEVKAVEPAFIFRFPDLEITFANLSRSARLAEIKNKLGEAAATEWDTLLKTGEYFWERMRENYLEWEFSWLRADLATLMKLRIPRVGNPYLQKILAHYATYAGYPAGLYKWSHILAFVEESFGVWQINGGLGALTNAVRTRAADLGSRFEAPTKYDFHVDATQVAEVPTQRLIGVAEYSGEIPARTVIFHESGLTTDIYATANDADSYSLVISGEIANIRSALSNYENYIRVDQIRSGTQGSADNQVLTKIRTLNNSKLRVRHLDTLAHAGICGELLANAVRGIKNRPSHEH